MAQHVDEVVLAVEDHHPLAAPAAGRAAPRLVGQPEAAEPGVAARPGRSARPRRAASSARSTSGTGAGRHQAEGAEDAAGLGVGLGDLVRRVGVAHQRRAGGDLEPALEVDVGGADDDRAVDDRLAVGRRGRRAPARRRSSRGPRLSYCLISRQAFSTGLPVTVAAYIVSRSTSRTSRAVRPARRYSVWIRCVIGLRNGPEHLAALVADVAHHLELLVDDHEELVDLLLVARGTPGAAASGSARRRRRRGPGRCR